MEKLDTVIKLVNKTLVKKVEWKFPCTHEQIINHTLEQQGIQKVLDLLNKVNDGDENLKEIMKNL